MSHFRLFVPKQAVGANLVYFDLFNAAGSCIDIEITTVLPVVSAEVAVAGAVGVDLYLTRTSAVGTGGTAATRNGTSLTACTITGVNNSATLAPEVTARLTPSGGATAGAVIGWTSVYAEEQQAQVPSENLVKHFDSLPALLVPQGTGIRVVQGSVASVGNIGFNVGFRIIPK